MTERTRWDAIAEELEEEKPAVLKIEVGPDESLGVDEVIVRNGDEALYTRPKFDFEKPAVLKIEGTAMLLAVDGVVVGTVSEFTLDVRSEPPLVSVFGDVMPTHCVARFHVDRIWFGAKLLGRVIQVFEHRSDMTTCFLVRVTQTTKGNSGLLVDGIVLRTDTQP